MSENSKKEDEYKVCLWGTTFSKIEAYRIGLAVLFSLVGAVVSIALLGPQNKMIAFFISLFLAFIGYFGIAKTMFKNKSKT
jgi:hypothetical protein